MKLIKNIVGLQAELKEQSIIGLVPTMGNIHDGHLSLIKLAKKTKTKVGICGQGESEYHVFKQFLVEEGIDTISVTSDSMSKTIKVIHKIENK